MGGGSAYNVFLNGSLLQVLEIQGSTTQQLFLSLDPSQQASVVVSKRTEALLARSSEIFQGIQVDEEARLLPGAARFERRLEVIGDSITSGFGVLGRYFNDPTCQGPFSRSEDSWMTYSLLLAHQLQGEPV